MKLKNPSKKLLKGKRRQNLLPRKEVHFFKIYRVQWKKAAETKTPKPEKKPQEPSSKTKSTEEKIK